MHRRCRHGPGEPDRLARLENARALGGQLDRVEHRRVLVEETQAHQLAADGGPFVAFVLLADAVSGKCLVSEPPDLLRVSAAQDLDDMLNAHAKAALIANPKHARKKFLGGQRAIELLARAEAIVATTAVVAVEHLAEVPEQLRASALAAFGVVQHAFELRERNLPFARVGLFVDEAQLLHAIAGAEEKQALARQAVAPGAARLLIIAFETLWQIVVDDEAHVRFVDAHAERDGGAHDPHFVAEESLLIARAIRRLHARVIGRRRDAIESQARRQILGRLAGETIDDAAFVRSFTQQGNNLRVSLGLGGDAVAEIRPVEARHVLRRVAHLQLLTDVVPHAARGGGRQRNDRHFWKTPAQFGQLAVLRPEVVTPLADAMRLIDREPGDRPAGQLLKKAGREEALGCEVEQFEFSVVQSAKAATRLSGIQRRVQESRGNAGRLQRVHLILHQGDQRRQHHGETVLQHGRQLVAKRLAATGREQHQHITAGERVAHDLGLEGTKRIEAEVLLQRGQRIAGVSFHGRRVNRFSRRRKPLTGS